VAVGEGIVDFSGKFVIQVYRIGAMVDAMILPVACGKDALIDS
jgi:hypothetical protein